MQGAGTGQPPELGGIILGSRNRLIFVTAKLQKVEELMGSLRKDLREKNLTTTRMSESTSMWNPLISNTLPSQSEYKRFYSFANTERTPRTPVRYTAATYDEHWFGWSRGLIC